MACLGFNYDPRITPISDNNIRVCREREGKVKLIEVRGSLWRLSLLQASSEKWTEGHEDEVNEALIAGRSGCYRGIIRFKSGDLRADATATIEIDVHGLPHRHQYEVYYSKKGHFCMVQKERVYLRELIEEHHNG